MTGLPSLRVAILGAGTVGRPVARQLLGDPDRFAPRDGRRIELVGVAVRDLERHARGPIPDALLTDAPAHLVADPNVDVIVELMGGDEPARTLIAVALAAGKSVVTANKHVLAHHGPELEAATRAGGGSLRFEAAVGAGIPVLGPLAADLAGNRVRRVRGIVNGTTNYILTTMARQGRSYAEVLAAAQASGFAEVEPRGDVEGDDSVNKLVILARLAFNAWLHPTAVPRRPPTLDGAGHPGITGVTTDEIAAAASLGLAIRLVAEAERVEDPAGGRIRASVLPMAVPADGLLGQTIEVTNRVEVDAEPVGRVAMSGPGAGGGPTSSAVLGDLIALARGLDSTWAGLPPAEVIHEGRSTSGHATQGAVEDGVGSAGWFAFLPGTRPTQVRSGSAGLYAVPVPGGTAVRSRSAPIADVRGSIAAILEPAARVTLYPVDD